MISLFCIKPPALTVKPLPLTSFPMYNPPARKQHQAVFSEPLLVPQVKSPTVMQTAIQSPQKDSKLSDVRNLFNNNVIHLHTVKKHKPQSYVSEKMLCT